MTIAQQVLFILEAPFQTPLQQADIAYRLGANAPSVRRTCQQLLRDGQIHVADYRGFPSAPRYAAGPKPVVSTAPARHAPGIGTV